MNYSYSSDWVDFLNMGRIHFDEITRQIVTSDPKNYAFYFYDHPQHMNDHLSLSSDPEYLKGRMEIPYTKARKYLPPEIQVHLQAVISEIYKQLHGEICEKRFNISQIGFVWNGGIIPYHSHFLPASEPPDTVTYFMALHQASSYSLEFNIKHADDKVENIRLLQKQKCTRVHFNSNLFHELKAGEGLYMFFLFNSIQLRKPIQHWEDLDLGSLR